MSDVRLVPAAIDLVYEAVNGDMKAYDREFQQIIDIEDDSIGQWIKHTKVRSDGNDSDPMILNLLVELYRKMDRIETFLTKGIHSQYLPLSVQGQIDEIGMEHFKLASDALEIGKIYYGRVEMPIYPKRIIPFYFEAVTSSLAKITKVNARDREEWAYYMTARERVMIRQIKGLE
jgi:hypothetical protein